MRGGGPKGRGNSKLGFGGLVGREFWRQRNSINSSGVHSISEKTSHNDEVYEDKVVWLCGRTGVVKGAPGRAAWDGGA